MRIQHIHPMLHAPLDERQAALQQLCTACISALRHHHTPARPPESIRGR